MNLSGVIGDSRKRIEAAAQAAAEQFPEFDLRPECAICQQRDPHTHVLVPVPVGLD